MVQSGARLVRFALPRRCFCIFIDRYSGTVKDAKERGQQVLVTFDGWAATWDEVFAIIVR